MKKVRSIIIKIVVFSGCVLFLSSETTLQMGLCPMFSDKALMQLFRPLADEIEHKSDYRIVLTSAPDRNTFRERILTGNYDLIWTTNSIYLQVNREAGYQAVAAGYPGYRGQVIVKNSSLINNLKDLKGKKILCTNEDSLAGYLFFRKKMKDLGLQPPDDYTVFFNENIEALPFLVLNGKYDAAVFSEQIYLDSGIYDKISPRLKTIAISRIIPRFPFAVSPLLREDTKKQIQDAIVSVNGTSEHGRKILEQLQLEGFMAVNDGYYNNFRALYKKSLSISRKRPLE